MQLVDDRVWKSALREGSILKPPDCLLKFFALGKDVTPIEEGLIPFVLSEESVDRHKDLIFVEGIQLANFLNNPVMPWGHRYVGDIQGDPPLVGNWEDVRVEGKQLLGNARFIREELSPFAWKIYRFYSEKLLRMVSIGFRAIEWGWNEDRGRWAIDYRQIELLECSAVMIGAHHNALSQMKSKGFDVGPLVKDLKGLLADVGEAALEPPAGAPPGVSEDLLKIIASQPGAHDLFKAAGPEASELFTKLSPEPAGSPPALDPYFAALQQRGVTPDQFADLFLSRSPTEPPETKEQERSERSDPDDAEAKFAVPDDFEARIRSAFSGAASELRDEITAQTGTIF